MLSRGLAFAAAASTASAAGYKCEGTDTVCPARFSRNGMGCCTMPGAVCCPNHQTCCPAGTVCADSGSYLSACVKEGQANTTGLSVCKFGPPLPFSTTLKNVLIIGDSVSIGYTPHVADALADVALVQHAPWDTSDGGAEETAYGLQCLDYFLRSPEQAEVRPDLVMFNFGLHDGPLGNATTPGQQGNSSVYPGQLAEITDRLVSFGKRTGSKIVFALTTPVLCSTTANGNVVSLNNEARAIMEKRGVAVLDNYSPIIAGCGEPPQTSCFGHKQCFCPHCPSGNATWSSGYLWLANTTIAPQLRAML